MRVANLFLFALSDVSLASPIGQEKRQSAETSVQTLLTDLYATVQVYTGANNATLAPLSPSSSVLEKAAAILQVGTQISKITAAITSTVSSIKELAPANATQPSLSTPRDFDVINIAQPNKPKEKRQLIAVGALLALRIVEIFATVTAAVAILELAGLLVFLNPLTSALSLLILAVQLVLDIVLLGVIALWNSLLAALALGVSGL